MASSGEIDQNPSGSADDIIIEHAYSEEQRRGTQSHAAADSSTSSSPSSAEEPTDEAATTSNNAGPEPSKKQDSPKNETEKVKSRELKSLLEAAKESNLDTNIVHKRESRKVTDTPASKSSSDQESGGKRTMRSQNPDFVAKHQKFLHKISSKFDNFEDVPEGEGAGKRDGQKTPKRKKDSFADDAVGGSGVEDVKKSRKSFRVDSNFINIAMKKDKDHFCWRCHRDGVVIQCETCPRAYHVRCLKQPVFNYERWPCPECLAILQAESTKTRSPAMRDMSLEHLCELLKYAAKRMISCSGSEPFIHPVDQKAFPDYRNYVVQPMDLTTIQNNIRNNLYGSTVAFLADAKWILHNSIIFNSYQSKLTTAAKSIVKICKQEMNEIETCAECYQNANTKKNSWFIEVCSKPHILLWAKLKGFPYWPAKGMTTNPAGLVDVRFFGAHDRAWIPIKECFLYSKKDPNTTNKHKRNNIAECIKEVDIHIEKLKETFGEFCYAPYRTTYDPAAEQEQLAFMLPKYKSSPKLVIPKTPSTPPSELCGTKHRRKMDKPRTSVSSDAKEGEYRKRSRSRASSDVSEDMRSDSRVRSEFGDDGELMTSSSKTSLSSDEKNDKMSQDYDKFMEGYGTEDDENSIVLNNDIRKKIKLSYDSDSDEDSPKAGDIKNGSEDSDFKMEEISVLNRGKVRTRGGYHNVTGKVKVLGGRKRSNNSSPTTFLETPTKMSRRNSDISTKSDSSRISGISDKINRVEEFSDTLEVSLASKDVVKVRSEFISTIDKISNSEKMDLGKFKPVIQVSTGDLYNKNKEFRISPQNKSESIADRLMKKITESELSEKVEAVKKQILDNLEAGTSDSQGCDGVSSSGNEEEGEANHIIVKKKDSGDAKAENGSDSSKKNQNVSSSTEASCSKTNEVKNAETSSSLDASTEAANVDESAVGSTLKSVLESTTGSSSTGKTAAESSAAGSSTTVDSSANGSSAIKSTVELPSVESSETRLTVTAGEGLPAEESSAAESTKGSSSEAGPSATKSSSVTAGESLNGSIAAGRSAEESSLSESSPVEPSAAEPQSKKVDSKKSIIKGAKEKLVKAIEKAKHSILSERRTRKIDDSEEETSGDESESEPPQGNSNKIEKTHVKLVNVSDIISGKINEKESQPSSLNADKSKTVEPESFTDSITESIEIKSEPVSEEDEPSSDNRQFDFNKADSNKPDSNRTDANKQDVNKQDSSKPLYDVTLTVVDKQKRSTSSTPVDTGDKLPFRVVDNLTKVIDSVASNYGAKPDNKVDSNKNMLNINRKEITLRPISKLIQSPKQKARKTFPNSPHKMQQQQTPIQIKKVPADKKEAPKPPTSIGLKVVSTLQTVTTQSITSQPSTVPTSSKDIYIAPQTSVMNPMALLPPNQPITLTQNVGNPILTMVQHPGMTTAGLIIQQNPTVPLSTVATPSTSHCTIITPGTEASPAVLPQPLDQNVSPEERSTIPDTIAKAVGDLLCKPPPKLKPKPPGPLSTYFDEGTPSSAGPTTKLINSVAHRLSDYFRGLLKETLQDLSAIGSPESKIRSLELEIETIKQKHAEEMLELRKNISSILKDIQKSIVEEKAKIVDETRAICEAERLRSVEEAKSKQWCAFCFKEAQFYCCWNTSYCDYPCQQKHWSTHMKTCSQTTVRNVPAVGSTTNSNSIDKNSMGTTGKQLTKNTYSNPNKAVLKSTRMIVKQTGKPGLPMYVPMQRPIQPGQQTITLVESTPGNFEIVGNHGPISLGGKLVPTTTIKVKPGNVITVASTSSNSTATTGSSGAQKTIILAQKTQQQQSQQQQVLNKSQSENKT